MTHILTTEPLPAPHKQHYVLLDASRGIAAIVVMLGHIGSFVRLPIFRMGFLAVDYFLLLSGFVIALSYERAMRDRLSLGAFLELRVLRLWNTGSAATPVLGLL